ncbi:MAG: LamG domain-containing protein [Candidatus Micrarchaeaceae archaeon]
MKHALKGFIFTLDAIFALVIATTSVSLLLYMIASNVTTIQAPAIKAASSLSNLASLTLGSAVQAGFLSGLANPFLMQNPSLAEFNGNSYISITAPAFLFSNHNFTLCAWVYSPSSGGSLISLSSSSNVNLLSMNSSSIIANISGVNGNAPFSAPALPNQWFFACLAYNISGKATLYVNGAPVKSATGTYAPPGSSGYLLIGALPAGSNGFIGGIANVQIYGNWKNPATVRSMYKQGLGGIPTGNPYSWYPLDGNANDYVRSNNGVSYGVYYANSSLLQFGNISLQTTLPLLPSIANLYINKQGVYASEIFSGIENFNSSAMFINGTYAPAMYLAQFNGKNSIISIPSLMNFSQFTISLWINPYQFKNATLFAMYPTSNGPYISMQQGTSGCTVYTSSGYNVKAYFHGKALCYPIQNINSWYNLIFTYNPGGTILLYVNGQLLQNTNASISSLTSNTTYQTIGNATGSFSFNGTIANLQIYNKTFSLSQALQLYGAGVTALPLKNIKEWLMLSGNANDYSMHFNNGVANNITYINSSYTPISLTYAFSISGFSIDIPAMLNNVAIMKKVKVISWT